MTLSFVKVNNKRKSRSVILDCMANFAHNDPLKPNNIPHELSPLSLREPD